MAEQFIGLHMRVILREPPGYQLTGTVKGVEAGNSLTLTNVFIAATNMHTPEMRINALNIADLSETKQQTLNSAPPQRPKQSSIAVPNYSQQTTATSTPTQTSFVDPAILSVGRRGGSSEGAAPPSTQENKASNSEASTQPRQPGLLFGVNLAAKKPGDNAAPASSKGLGFTNLGATAPQGGSKPAGTATTTAATPEPKKTSRPPRQAKGSKAGSGHVGAAGGEENNRPADGSPMTVHKGHGKGWRQTPILQSTASFQPFNSLKKNGKGGHNKQLADNGWASEDVTEEMGDFDFENNLAKFDKRTIFDQMRKEDEVDDADRLVTHNRKPKPGTAGGKNLHYTESVLEVPTTAAPGPDFWNSEADVDGSEGGRLSGRELRNGSSQAMRRTDSKSGPPRRSQSRKASTTAGAGGGGGQPVTRVNSVARQPALPSRLSTPRSGYRSAEVTQQQQQQQQQHQQRQPGLYLVPSDRRLEAISTLQMLNLENIAANEIGFSEGLMAENAGRGIAEVSVTALSDPAIKVRFELAAAADASLNSTTIVILAGNNKSSIRALAAGRHLRNKNFEVVVCLVGIERERDLLEDLRRQIQLYRSFGGKVLNKSEFFEYLRGSGGPAGTASTTSGGVQSASVSVSLIVDALLGLTMSFEELRIGDQATVYELMEWANRNEAFVLAVDVPSGIDPTSGKIAIIDGGQLFIKPRYVVAIGAPKRGLLEVLTQQSEGGGLAIEDEWRLFVADMGLGNAVWRKAGAKIRKGVDFDGRWVVEMRYHGLDVDEDDD